MFQSPLARYAWPDLDIGPQDDNPAVEPGRVHLVGIGGIGMSGIAEVLLTLGYRISGSDLHQSDTTRRLAAFGADIVYGHDAATIDRDIDAVVVSSAISGSNAEVAEARRLMVPVISRAEMLAELMRAKCGVAVAGAHGKTTTTSLVASVLAEGGFDPTMVVGGRLRSLGGTNARLGDSRYMVAEADESDGSFLLLKPTVAVVTNIDREHMDHYGTMDALRQAYVDYINSIPFFGRAVLCIDCEEVAGLLERLKKRYVCYGTSDVADLRAVDIRPEGLSVSFEVVWRGVALGRARVAMPGHHAVLNALAALAVGLEFGMTFEDCREGLEHFGGILRRFELKGEAAGVTVIDDYGHHPTEIRATLAAARAAYPGRRLVALFQPHRYTRTADLFDEFVRCFDDADEVLVTDIYAAGESAGTGPDGAALAAAIAAGHRGTVGHLDSREQSLAGRVAGRLGAGDLLVTLGAGDITRSGPEILALLEG